MLVAVVCLYVCIGKDKLFLPDFQLFSHLAIVMCLTEKAPRAIGGGTLFCLVSGKNYFFTATRRSLMRAFLPVSLRR